MNFPEDFQEGVGHPYLPVGKRSQPQGSSIEYSLWPKHRFDSAAKDVECAQGEVDSEAWFSSHNASDPVLRLDSLSLNDRSWHIPLAASATSPSLLKREGSGGEHHDSQRGAPEMNLLTEENLHNMMQDELTQSHNTKPFPRDHIFYSAEPRSDGAYYCPFISEGCTQPPLKHKNSYDKHLDEHMEPYRCRKSECGEKRFASTACLLRHERLAHHMHGRDDNLYSCPFEFCSRSAVESGFSRKWNLDDHMRRVHQGAMPRVAQEHSAESKSPFGRAGSFSPSVTGSAGESTEASSQSGDSTKSEFMHVTLLRGRHILLVSLMKSFYDFMRVSSICRTATTGSSSQETSCSSQSTKFEGQANDANISRKGRKRPNDQEDEHPNDDHNKKRDKKQKEPGSNLTGSRLFACPYHQHDHRTYCVNSLHGAKYRTCAGPGFKQLSHVRQHLRRVHQAPVHCPRCWNVMTAKALAAHLNLNSDDLCERVPGHVEGIDQDKSDLIHNEQHGESWRKIYSIIFPGAEIPSEYFDASSLNPMSPSVGSDLQDLADFTRTRLPQMVETNLSRLIENDLASVELRLRQLLPEIVRSCQEAVYQSFQAWRDLKTPQSASSRADSRLDGAETTRTNSPPQPDHSQERGMISQLDLPQLPSISSPPPLDDFDEILQDTGCSCSCHDNYTGLACNDYGCSDCTSRHYWSDADATVLP